MNLSRTFAAVQYVSHKLLALNDEKTNQILLAVTGAAEEKTGLILAENRKDLNHMDASSPRCDRLMLAPERLKGIATDIRRVAKLPSPVGHVQKQGVMPNGLKVKRVNVSLGVIGIIYEARPNTSFDVFSLYLKNGNACTLKGGSGADCSNRAIISMIHDVLKQFETDLHIVELLPSDRGATTELLRANGCVDLITPHGSSNLINFVRQNATISVIETGADIYHTFPDRCGDVEMRAAIVNNAKTRHVSVCNALDCLLVDADRTKGLPALCASLQENNVIIYTDTFAYISLRGHYPAQLLEKATEEDFGTEFLDYKMAVKAVEGIDSAVAHIQ